MSEADPSTTVFDHSAREVIELGNRLLDDDGSAIIIHDGADDYESQPTGNAGGRIACGPI